MIRENEVNVMVMNYSFNNPTVFVHIIIDFLHGHPMQFFNLEAIVCIVDIDRQYLFKVGDIDTAVASVGDCLLSLEVLLKASVGVTSNVDRIDKKQVFRMGLLTDQMNSMTLPGQFSGDILNIDVTSCTGEEISMKNADIHGHTSVGVKKFRHVRAVELYERLSPDQGVKLYFQK
ncbi:hypothetical protein ES708_29176 [subsurface metagenome]